MFNNGLRLIAAPLYVLLRVPVSQILSGLYSPSAPERPSALAAPPIGIVLWLKAANPLVLRFRRTIHGISNLSDWFRTVDSTGVVASERALANSQLTATALSEHGPVRRVFNFYDDQIHWHRSARDAKRTHNQPEVSREGRLRVRNPGNSYALWLYPEDPKIRSTGDGQGGQGSCHVLQQRGRMFLCETGEETPTTLLRMIQDVALDKCL